MMSLFLEILGGLGLKHALFSPLFGEEYSHWD